MSLTRPLRIFLCYASQDLAKVRKLFGELQSEAWLNPWFDKENLLPGMNWDLEINKALREADVIIVCLSNESIAKEGYIQKEFKRALSFAEEKPEGTIYIIPLRLDDCEPPVQFQRWQWLDYFVADSREKLLRSLTVRANELGIQVSIPSVSSPYGDFSGAGFDIAHFVPIYPSMDVRYVFYIGKYPVTNAQYERFLRARNFSNSAYWIEFPKYDQNCTQIGDWRKAGWGWLQRELETTQKQILAPRYWYDMDFGINNPDNPVVGLSWYEANAYCEWLFQNWDNMFESKANPGLKPQMIRLPLEKEWRSAAGGENPGKRYPWDEPGKTTTSLKEISRRANMNIDIADIGKTILTKISLHETLDVYETGIGRTTPVNKYPLGKSPYGVMDMSGNVFEWQANFYNEEHTYPALRGGSWDFNQLKAYVAYRDLTLPPYQGYDSVGFRVVIISGG